MGFKIVGSQGALCEVLYELHHLKTNGVAFCNGEGTCRAFMRLSDLRLAME